MTTHNEPRARTINCAALRTLHALELTLRRHTDELMQVDCEEAEAAEAIVFAIESVERSLDHARVAKRRITRA